MRILLVAPVKDARRSASFFYAFHNHLVNGFTRNGHFVLTFGDYAYLKHTLGIRKIAIKLANRDLLEVARQLRPDLLCLHMSVLITSETVHRIKEELPGCRVAVTWYDPIFSANTGGRFARRLDGADFGFATTAGPTLAEFAGRCPVAFIPNPIDVSVENVKAYATRDKTADVFCAMRKEGPVNRFAFVDELQREKPALSYAIYGRNKQDLLYGDAYYRALDLARVGLNLNKREGDLYASDRMAQYLGNGLLVASYRRSGFHEYFDDDEMIFFDGPLDLGEQIERAVADDTRWRLMAERGRAKALALMNETRVTDFVLRMTLGLGPPRDWPFLSHIFPHAARIEASSAMPQNQRECGLSDDQEGLPPDTRHEHCAPGFGTSRGA